MSEASNKKEVKEPLIQIWAIWIALIVFVLALGIYAIQFIWGLPHLSPNPETWGQLGDFLGGMVNPIIGLITILLLATSLKQNQIALQQSKDALKRAEEEVRLTREALEQSKSIQEATESALREQIRIAQITKDIDNVINLERYFRETLQLVATELEPNYSNLLQDHVKKLQGIIFQEVSSIYGRWLDPQRRG
ncbi:MAG: hypothetical protein ACI4NJ_00645 [Cellvibrio sp.]